MPLTFKCPNCRARLSFRDSLAGQDVTCPKCHQILTLPLPIPPEKLPLPLPPMQDLRETSEETTGQSGRSQPRRSGKPASRLPYIVAIVALAGVLVAENVWLLARPSGESKTAATTERTVEKESGKEPGKESTGTPTPAAGSSNSVAPSPTIATPQEQPKPKKTIYLRDDFKARVIGKSASEVLEAVGRPDSTRESGTVINCWYFDNITKDPVTNKLDSYVVVSFDKKGKVETVAFY
jgi:xanthosine utilization system XapX-like protein